MSDEAVYVVDGDPAVRDSLRTLLDLNGYRVKTFSTGGALLRELGKGTTIQCIVCEADLPDANGIEIFQILSDPGVDSTPAPFALLVSRRNPSIVRKAHEAGIDQVFLKPLVHRHLVDFISSRIPPDSPPQSSE